MTDIVCKLKYLYSEQPLPDSEAYQTCMRCFAYEVYNSPIVEFCEYVYTRQISWCNCSWEKDILPLEEDTTILPDYIFSTPFLRYYFPTCLHIAIKYFHGAYYQKDVGNVGLFVERTLFCVSVLVNFLNFQEKQFMMDICALMKRNEFYKCERLYADLYRVLKEG